MNLAVFDLETNGMTGSSVLSASSIVFDGNGRVLDFFNRFYLPREALNVHALRVHGLTLGRLAALRRRLPAPRYFLEDCVALFDFWDHWNVEGIVVHNLAFDASFLPEIAQGAFRWWCSMKGLTTACAIPKRAGDTAPRFKWPKLQEAVQVLCDGLNALTPPAATRRLEEALGEAHAHVSLYDCFALYRVVSRVALHNPELLDFAPFLAACPYPRRVREKIFTDEGPAVDDFFTANVLAYEKKLRSAI